MLIILYVIMVNFIKFDLKTNLICKYSKKETEGYLVVISVFLQVSALVALISMAMGLQSAQVRAHDRVLDEWKNYSLNVSTYLIDLNNWFFIGLNRWDKRKYTQLGC